MDVSQYLEIFIDESAEHLQTLSDCIMELEKEPDNKDVINEIFRAAHSLKGMAGTMGFKRMQHLTHDMENVFQEVRSSGPDCYCLQSPSFPHGAAFLKLQTVPYAENPVHQEASRCTDFCIRCTTFPQHYVKACIFSEDWHTDTVPDASVPLPYAKKSGENSHVQTKSSADPVHFYMESQSMSYLHLPHNRRQTIRSREYPQLHSGA